MKEEEQERWISTQIPLSYYTKCCQIKHFIGFGQLIEKSSQFGDENRWN